MKAAFRGLISFVHPLPQTTTVRTLAFQPTDRHRLIERHSGLFRGSDLSSLDAVVLEKVAIVRVMIDMRTWLNIASPCWQSFPPNTDSCERTARSRI
jgi:cobyrinic acid a,c-diamide synthase